MACLIFKYLNSTNNFTVASYIFLNEFRLIQYLNPFFLLRFMLDFLYLCGFNKIKKKKEYIHGSLKIRRGKNFKFLSLPLSLQEHLKSFYRIRIKIFLYRSEILAAFFEYFLGTRFIIIFKPHNILCAWYYYSDFTFKISAQLKFRNI